MGEQRHRPGPSWWPLAVALGIVGISVLVTGGGASARSRAGIDEPNRDGEADVERIYLRDCAVCHGNEGQGTRRGPTLVGVGAASAHYYLTTGRMPLAEPDDRVERGAPAYGPEVIAGLILTVASFGDGPPVPEVALDDADLGRGGDLYRLNCAACHHAAGSGGALIDREAPPLHQATAVQTVEALRVGPGSMPRFGVAALDEDEARDVAAYVSQVLRDPPDRGGAPIWRLGPVPEGAVAIVVGLGVLMLLGWWIEGGAGPTSDRTDQDTDGEADRGA